MNYSNLTITFSKGRRGTIIGKIQELPEIIARGTNLEEVRAKILQALALIKKAGTNPLNQGGMPQRAT
jgi:predicted RNase H-like HicB family nuclease